MASSSFSTRLRNDYDVFLSFRGEDTRRTIVSYLYEALCREGIFTFRDDHGIEAGDNFSDRLIQAINTSRFAVVVISENYATSKWCLEELRLIMELHSENRIQVVPIFYGVEPSNVRHQTESFAAAFQEYDDLDTAPERVSHWRRALNQVGHLLGFHSRTWHDEAAMINKVVGSISSQLLRMKSTIMNNLVRMEAHMVKMNLLLNMGSEDEVLMIGIWGMGGIGKTTIAKCLYDRFSSQFSARYFIEDIKKTYKDKSPSDLQENFLSRILSGERIGFRSDEAGSQEIKARLGQQKVLVVLDGVDKAEQVHALAKDTSWFGLGSRIIITTRDGGLLNSCGVNDVYEVKCLDDKDALQVFKNSAFRGRPPPSDGFEQLFIRASRLAHGLPSALVTYATYLSENATIEKWEDELGLLETRPHKNVEEILRNSYDDLDEQDKTAFLYVACFLNGYPFNHVTSLLDGGRPRINHLTAKSLISISLDGCIKMHFLVVQTGRAIVCQESRNRPSRQRFLWDPNEIYYVLDNNIGTDEIEGVTLHMCEMPDKLPMDITVFNVMHNIKFLKFFQHLGAVESKVQLKQEGFYFPPNLRLLHWDAYPLKTLPSRFRHHHLVELDLQCNNLESLWDRTVNLRNLRRLDVTGSKNLRELPDLSTALNFEELKIDGCLRLQHIPESLRSLSRLTKLNAIHCDILRGVRFTVCLDDWRINTGSWQFSLIFPNEGAQVSCLKDLSIEGQIYIELSALRGNTEHISFSSKQHIHEELVMMEQRILTPQLSWDSGSSQSLNIKQFRYREFNAPFTCNSFLDLPSLTELKLVNLNIQEIPNDIDWLLTLEILDLSGNDFVYLPTTMGQLPKLKYLSLRNCRKLKTLPQLTQVETLILSDCVNLRSLLELHVEEEHAINCLLELWLDNCKNVQPLSEKLRCFTKLTYLDLSRHEFVTVPSSIKELSSLETLCLNNCKKLESLEELPLSLNYLYAHGCESLLRFSLSSNYSTKHLDLSHCFSLNNKEDLISQFIDGDHSQVVTPAFACFPRIKEPCSFGRQQQDTCTRINLPPSRFGPKLLGFVVSVEIVCEGPFHLQFPAFSFDWNWEAGRVLGINLKPNLYLSTEMKADKDAPSCHLVIIHVPNSINNEDDGELRFEAHLLAPEDSQFPHAETRFWRVCMIFEENLTLENLEILG